MGFRGAWWTNPLDVQVEKFRFFVVFFSRPKFRSEVFFFFKILKNLYSYKFVLQKTIFWLQKIIIIPYVQEDTINMPVPSSFNDITTDPTIRKAGQSWKHTRCSSSEWSLFFFMAQDVTIIWWALPVRQYSGVMFLHFFSSSMIHLLRG